MPLDNSNQNVLPTKSISGAGNRTLSVDSASGYSFTRLANIGSFTSSSPNLSSQNTSPDTYAKEHRRLEKSNSHKIDLFLKEEKDKYLESKSEPKLLILGSSDSGKSTLLKQLRILHGSGFSDAEKEWIRECIVWQVMEGLGVLIGLLKENYASDDLLTKYGAVTDFYNHHLSNPLPTSPKMISRYHRKHIASPTSSSMFLNTTAGVTASPRPSISISRQNSLVELMSDELVGLAVSATSEELLVEILAKSYNIHQLPESTDYFFKKSKLVLARDYIPCNDDILMQRSVTQNISDTVFKYKEKSIHFIDVSGLKGHRKKWLPYFEDVHSVLYVVSLSSFDQKMVEDGSMNRMADALVLFEQVVTNPCLLKTDIVLFLNKKDLFMKKAQTVNLKIFFPEYQGKEYSVSGYADFFRTKFLSLNKTKRNMAVHSTCCTDTKAMQVIISSMLVSVTTRTLRETGMIM